MIPICIIEDHARHVPRAGARSWFAWLAESFAESFDASLGATLGSRVGFAYDLSFGFGPGVFVGDNLQLGARSDSTCRRHHL
jgi:hypothetical protein